MGGFVGSFICENSPTLVVLAMAADKHQEVEVLFHMVSQCQRLQDCLGALEKFVFELNKFSKGIKDDLKTISSEAQNRRNIPLLLKNVWQKQL